MILILLLPGVLVQAAAQASAQNFAIQAGAQNFATDRILVKFKTGALAASRQTVHARQRGTVVREISRLGIQVVQIPAGTVAQEIQAYKGESSVEFAEPDYLVSAIGVPNDPSYANQWGLAKIQAPQAWDVTTGNSTVIIAILDTGVDQNHEDLAAKIESNKNFTTSNTTDDLYGHGTHVAGIAAAITNNNIGIAGVGYNSRIMNVKVLDDDGNGSSSSVAEGIIWAVDNGAKVINLSLGSSSGSSSIENAINYAWNGGAVIVAAAGNSGNTTAHYPAYYSNAIAVAATDSNDVKASFSNYGSWVDVAAPGVNIYSTLPNHPNSIGLNYGSLNGTSMAAPYVAGLAGLIWATSYGTSNINVRNRIESTADNISGTGTYWQFGRINAYNAVSIPTVTTDNATNITTTGARLNGNLTYLGGASSANVSFQWGLTSGNYTDNTTTVSANATGAFYFDLGSLSANTTHYYRARAVGQATGYGIERTFTTLNPPLVTTDNATNVSFNSARLNGNLNSLGTASSANVSFQYSTTSGNLTISTGIIALNLAGAFSANLTSLSSNTTYYFRAVAVGHGSSSGNETSFTTLSIIPTVTTDNATNITTTGARLNGNLTYLGGASSANVSFQWGLTSGNYTDNTTAVSVNATGAFYFDLGSLSSNTTYYYRARAVGQDTGYGAEKSFMLLSVTTSNADNITTTGGRLSGNLTSLGSAASVNVSFQWGIISGNYTDNTTAVSANATGAFSVNVTALSPSTIYYFRAMANGGAYGITYGTEKTFTTLSIIPTVTTDNATNITTTGARLNGNLTYLGGASSANVSFQWGLTSGNYTDNTTTVSANATGVFYFDLGSLSANTTHYYRARAVGQDTGYGTEKTFTTLSIIPTVVTDNATNIITTGARLNGNLTYLGGASSANVSFQWGLTSGNYTAATILQTANAIGAFYFDLGSLSANTTHYYRARAVGQATGYGAEKTFTTLGTPMVSTDGSSSVATNSATLSGSLTAMGTATTVNASFEYGTTTAYGSYATTQAMSSSGSFIANITGLVAGTGYHFRAKADGGASGVSYGADMTFATSSASSGGGGGGGGGSSSSAQVSLTGFTSSGTINLSSSGATTTAYVIESTDKSCTIQIVGGTKLVDASGTPLTSLTYSIPSTLPDAPANVGVLSARELGPSGARFEPPISLTLTYDQTALSPGVDKESLYIAFWDGTGWTALPTVLDTTLGEAKASISHFTIYAVMVPAPVVTPPITPPIPVEPAPPIAPSTPVASTPPIAPPMPVAPTPPTVPPAPIEPIPPTIPLTPDAPTLSTAPTAPPAMPPTTPALPTTAAKWGFQWWWGVSGVVALAIIGIGFVIWRRGRGTLIHSGQSVNKQ